MRKLLNTLYITLPNAYLAQEGENVLVKVDDEIRFRVPVHNIESIISFGYPGASPGLMRLCCERGVTVSFITEYGRFMGRITGEVSGNVLLRKKQYRWADDKIETLRLAKRFILAKMQNARYVLQRAIRDHETIIPMNDFVDAVHCMEYIPERLRTASDLETVRGVEGEAANVYFQMFDHLILAQKDQFHFYGRNRRPPKDNINALLSFAYSLLTHDCTAALESVGLDPQVGYLHRDRPGRDSLSLDLMEELRSCLADRFVLSLINLKQIDAKGFLKKESGAVVMDDNTRKIILGAWQKRKQDEITHPFLGERIPVGLIPYTQALMLSRHLRGDLEDYPPFFWK